jgi:hypothetical protein
MTKVLIEIKNGEVQGVYSDKDIQFVIVNQDKVNPVSDIFFSDENYLNLADVFKGDEDVDIRNRLLQLHI